MRIFCHFKENYFSSKNLDLVEHIFLIAGEKLLQNDLILLRSRFWNLSQVLTILLKPANNLVCTVLSTSYCAMCIVMFWDVVISTHLGGRNLCTNFFILLITIFFLSVEVPPVLSKGARAQLKSPPITICISACLLRLSLSFVKNAFWLLLSFGL